MTFKLDKRREEKISKYLSFVLRHNSRGYTMDSFGWVPVSEFTIKDCTLDELQYVVKNDNKQRFEFSVDGSKIRARQGHSLEVDVELQEKEPPEILYHGTLLSSYRLYIIREGIKKMNRQHVHLSGDIDTAKVVATRRQGEWCILRVQAKQMHDMGFKFYLSNNGVWLTDYVPTLYLSGRVKRRPNGDLYGGATS